MEKMIQSDVRKQIWKMILAASCSVLSFHQILTGYYTLQNILLTLAAAFLCAYWFATKTWEENSGYIGQNIRTSVIILILVSCTVWKEYQSSAGVRRDSLKVQMPVNFFRIRWYLFSIVFLWYFAVWLYRRMKDLVLLLPFHLLLLFLMELIQYYIHHLLNHLELLLLLLGNLLISPLLKHYFFLSI